jgi:hypothetical protein
MNKSTGKSFSETLILASTNPQNDKRLFIELQVQFMKLQAQNMLRTRTAHIVCINCSEHVLSLQSSCTEDILIHMIPFTFWNSKRFHFQP